MDIFKTKSKNFWIVLLMSNIFVSLSLYAQKPYMEESFAVGNNVHIEVLTSGGSIEVKGSERDNVHVEMIVKQRGKAIEAGEADLDNWDISIDKRGNTVYATAEKRNRINWGRDNFSISFVVYAPIDSKADVKTSGGRIILENLEGDQRAKTSGGSITASQIIGELHVHTSGGSITLDEIEGTIKAHTSGGRIRATEIHGEILAKTSGGSITLEDIIGNVEAKTSGGSIDAEIVKPDEYIDLKTSGGSINVTVPEEGGYDLNLDGNRVRADLSNFDGDYEKDEVDGTMNGGGTRLTAKTSGGSVTMRYL